MNIERILRRSVWSACLAVASGCAPGGGGGGGGGGAGGGGGTAVVGADRDGDGLSDHDEVMVWGTSPDLADTDGDGFDDGREVDELAFGVSNLHYRFNPVIADRPGLTVSLDGPPAISIDYETTETASRVVGTERSSATTTANTQSWGGANSTTVEQSHSVGASAGTSGVDVSYEYSQSTSTETSTSWTNEQSQENSEALARMEAFEQSNEVTSTSGSLEITAKIRNTGNIAYRLDELTLSAYEVDPARPGITSAVGTLRAGTISDVFAEQLIGPGDEVGPLSFEAELDLDTAKALLQNSRNLMIRPIPGNMTGEPGAEWPLAGTVIRTRTMQVIVDYGLERPPETHLVSLFGTGKNTIETVADAFDVLDIPVSQGTLSMRRTPDGAPEPTHPTVVKVREFEASDEANTLWYVVHSRVAPDGAGRQVHAYHPFERALDIATMDVAVGDVVHLIRIVDEDRDGLGARLEHAYGTDATRADTDGDGCDDGLEVNGWSVDGQSYRSNPALVNTDGDAFDDCDEHARGSNPADVDNPDAYCNGQREREVIQGCLEVCAEAEDMECYFDCWRENGLAPDCLTCIETWDECVDEVYTGACRAECEREPSRLGCAECVSAVCGTPFEACAGLTAQPPASCGEAYCADDEWCVASLEGGLPVCARLCDVSASHGAMGDTGCDDGDVCVDYGEGIGVCSRGCAPYPRSALYEECRNPNSTCAPYLPNAQEDNPHEPIVGFCLADEGAAGLGERCDEETGCEDYAVCFADEDGMPPVCHALCEPLTSGGCEGHDGDYFCMPSALVGESHAVGVCLAGEDRHRLGSHDCRNHGRACAGNNTICVDVDGHAGSDDDPTTCFEICRFGGPNTCGNGRCYQPEEPAWGWWRQDATGRIVTSDDPGVCQQ